jgi:hypothetical protein
MFFKISSECDTRFAENIPLTDEYWFNCDEGWQQITNYNCKIGFYKGYCFDHCDFIDELITDPTPKHNGNFCLVYVNNNNEIVVTHDKERSFPLFQDGKAIGVIGLSKNTKITADNFIIINDDIVKNKLKLKYNFQDKLTLDEAAQQILEILLEKFTWLKNNCIKPKLFFTGGIDSLVCLAILHYCNIDYELLQENHYYLNKFSLNFKKEMFSNSTYWGYKQINYYNKPNMSITGAMGDENFMRGPTTIKLLLEYYKINIDNILKPSHYHYEYFNRNYNKEIFNSNLEPKFKIYTKDYKKLCEKIIDINLNDHQHWHIGQTLSFTPFKDLNILSTVLSVNYFDIEKQITDAALQKRIIELVAPEMLKYLNQQKNPTSTTLLQVIQDFKNHVS